MLAKPHPARRIVQRMRIHKPRPAFGKLALAPFWKRLEQIFSREQLQNSVSEEFQPFIIPDGGRFSRFFRALCTQFRNRGAMRQSALEEFRLLEPITKTLLELPCVTLCHVFERYAKRKPRLFRCAQLRGAQFLGFFGATLARRL